MPAAVAEVNPRRKQRKKQTKNEAPRAKARGFSERNTERPRSIRTLKGAVLWPRMYKA